MTMILSLMNYEKPVLSSIVPVIEFLVLTVIGPSLPSIICSLSLEKNFNGGNVVYVETVQPSR